MDPEYECLNEILNDEQCDLCLCFEVRKPLSFEEVVKRSGWPAGRVNRVLNEVCDIGMIEYNWEMRIIINSLCFLNLFLEQLNLWL